MKPNHPSSSRYIYEVDNIPNFESHRYGCSKRLIALRAFYPPIYPKQQKAALSAGTPNTANTK